MHRLAGNCGCESRGHEHLQGFMRSAFGAKDNFMRPMQVCQIAWLKLCTSTVKTFSSLYLTIHSCCPALDAVHEFDCWTTGTVHGRLQQSAGFTSVSAFARLVAALLAIASPRRKVTTVVKRTDPALRLLMSIVASSWDTPCVNR